MLDCGRHICVFVLLDHASTFYALTPVIFFCCLSMGKNVLSYVLYLFGHSVVCKSYQVVFILVSIERTPTHCGQAATIQPSEEMTVFSRTHIFRTCKAKRVPLSLSHFYVLYHTSLFEGVKYSFFLSINWTTITNIYCLRLRCTILHSQLSFIHASYTLS